MNASTDALFTVLKGYFLAFACKELKIDNVDSDLEHSVLKSASILEKQRFIACLSMKVVENCTIIGNSLLGKNVEESGDQKYNYTRSLCHYGSLALEFYDAWHEGDGNRIIRCWRIFLLHFFESGRTKYSIDAMRLQLQISHLPSSMVQQIIWDRFVNTHGGMGRNLPCDLHNEHVNKELKSAIRHMGSNFTQNALTSVARSITYMSSASAQFDKQCGITGSSAHSIRDDFDDVKKIVGVVKRENLWESKKSKRPRHYLKFNMKSTNPLFKLNRQKLEEWMKNKTLQYKKYRQLNEGKLSGSESSDIDLCNSD